MHSLFLST